MNEQRRQAYLKAMDIPAWEPRLSMPPVKATVQQETVSSTDQPTKPVDQTPVSPPTETFQDWAQLEQAVSACQACDLHQQRHLPVLGCGDRQASVMFIGEAPGAEEDRQGEPFVGRAGQLLNEILAAIGLQRSEVYIANLVKCRPPNNRDPQVQELSACEHFLKQQIDWIKPDILIALGRFAAQHVLQTDKSLGQLRGQLHIHPQLKIPVVVTYHPAYLLRKPIEKRKVWQDMSLYNNTRSGVAS